MKYRNLIFSKDRASQLLALLESLERHCLDITSIDTCVLYLVTTEQHERQYKQLEETHDWVKFQREKNIESDILSLLQDTEHVTFFTDDSICIRDFRIKEVAEMLQAQQDSIGFSLRLGRNITYSYPHSCSQDKVDFEEIAANILKINWTKYKCDFGYPMELSSSVYRTSEILQMLCGTNMSTLKHVENSLWQRSKQKMTNKKPYLLCYPVSRTFSNALNITAPDTGNRYSKRQDCTIEKMADNFDEGYKIDVSTFDIFTPIGCHQEVDLSWVKR